MDTSPATETLGKICCSWALVLLAGCAPEATEEVASQEAIVATAPIVGTFSIVAVDPDTGEIGVAVQSRIVAVGAVVPYAEAGVGAVATQAAANPHYGPFGLALLHKLTPQETIQVMVC